MENREKNGRFAVEKKVFSYMEEHKMLAPGDRVILGVSGGADSVCLFLLLSEYAKAVPLSLSVVHVNHCIRAEAAEDARYVEALCRERGVPFSLVEADVRSLAAREGYSEEDAGRRVRYEAFEQAAKRLGGAKVAVAHNSNDNAETMLFHLFRGSGIQGLSGIAPVRGRIIRPILCLERREVEAYLKSVSVSWCRDSTNEKDAYRRNRIRHHILPYAEAEVVSGAVGHMARAGELLRETEEYLEQQTQEALRQCVKEISRMSMFRVDVSCFGKQHSVLRKRMLLYLLKQLSPTKKDISSIHVMDTLALFEREGNRSVSLPFGIRAWRQYGSVFLERGEAIQPASGERNTQKGAQEGKESGGRCFMAGCSMGALGCLEKETAEKRWKTAEGEKLRIAFPLTGEIFHTPLVYSLGDWGKIEFMGFFIKKGQEVPQKRYTKWFDYDKIKECVEIRSRRQGDYLTIADKEGALRHKSLKDYMVTEKIPRQIRDVIPLVAEGSHVLWLPGWRISAAYKVSENTERILQIRLFGDNFSGEDETEEKNGGEH